MGRQTLSLPPDEARSGDVARSELSAQLGQSERGDATTRQVSGIVGTDFAGGAGAVMFAAEFADRDPIGFRDREFSTPTGNLAGIGTRYTPVNIQQRFLFPPGPGRGGRGPAAPAGPSPTAVTVTVTPAGGPAVSGVLVQLDDFTVALRDASGAYRSFRRSPSLKVEKTIPLAAHIALLETITDKQIHDVVAYLETLK